ncbi:phosphatidylethanolamine N-methyltransferase isoform 2-T2 [Polymixia lowei]
MTLLEEVLKYIDVCDPRFCVAVIAIIFNPFFWNVVARWEHRTRGLTRLFGGPYLACYCLGFLIILLNVYRSHSMTLVMKAQARWEAMARVEVFYAGVALMVWGTLLVVSSFLALGFTGTFLGDYFGILMDEKVTGFPFNIIDNPMYWGSTANYLGLALIGASPVGLVLTAVVAISYKVAITFEGSTGKGVGAASINDPGPDDPSCHPGRTRTHALPCGREDRQTDRHADRQTECTGQPLSLNYLQGQGPKSSRGSGVEVWGFAVLCRSGLRGRGQHGSRALRYTLEFSSPLILTLTDFCVRLQ